MKYTSGGVVEHWIEVPIEVHYSCYPEEKQTRHYPGVPAHIVVDFIKYPTSSEMGEIIDKHAKEIKEACEENERE